MKPPPPTERYVQREILRMLEVCFPSVVFHHSPNGAHLAGGDAARFKQMGALRGDGMQLGFPDLILMWNHGIAFVEVKRPKLGKISPEQDYMHVRIQACGFPVHVVTSAQEVFALLKERGAPCRVQAWREAA